ncbi:glycosyltransferase [bacterium]|nr:glycosyltransferase [bacterium]
MKILHVIDSVNVKQGGPAVSVPALAEAQAKLGHSVGLVCRDFPHLGPQVRPDGVRMISVRGNRWEKMLGCFGRKFREAVLQAAATADVVHSHGLWTAAGVYARVASCPTGKPRLVISPRGMLSPWALKRSPIKKAIGWRIFEKPNLEKAGLLHVTSDLEKDEANLFLSRQPRMKHRPPLLVVPNGVYIPDAVPGRETVENMFPQLKGKRWLLFISRIHPKKGLLELAKAWRQVQEKFPAWELVIAGPVDDKRHAKKVAEELRGMGVWVGEVRGMEKWSFLNNSEVTVLPSHSENFGNVITEALAVGRPVVTTTGTPWGAAETPIRMRIRMMGPSFAPNLASSGGASEGGRAGGTMNLEARKCGVICEVTDLQRGLERMLGVSEKERQEMGARGREWMQKEFSWAAVAKNMIEAYRKK